MSKLAAVLVALFTVGASGGLSAANAASAEDAIKAWIASVPGNDWKVAYKNLAYDAASDKTTLTGLSAASTSLDLTIAFDTIAITGYAAASDGGFAAASLTVNTGTLTTPKAKGTITGISAKDFGTASMPPPSFDPDHPFTSLVQIYADLVKVHVGHAGIDSVSVTNDSDGSTFSYRQFAVDNWANGKIGSMTSGAVDASFTDDSGAPGSVHVGGFEARDADIDAVLRVYDPSRYQNGVGDQVWRPAIGLAAYHDFVIDSSDFTMTLGAWSIENVRVRQPAHSFTGALDKAAASGSGDLGPEGAGAMIDMWSAFALGKLSVSNVSVDTDGGSGSLDAFTLADFSSDGIGQISFDGIAADFPDGFARIGRIAAGNIVFPGLDKLAAALASGGDPQDIDYADLSTRLGYVEASSVDLATPVTPELTLDDFRLDLSDYVGLVPTNLALKVTGFDAPVSILEDVGSDTTLSDLDYDRIHADYGVKLIWNEADKTVTVDGFHLAFRDVGTLDGSATFSGLTREELANVESLRDALSSLDFVRSTISVSDDSLIGRWIAQQAYLAGVDQDTFRQSLVDSVPDMVSDFSDGNFKTKLIAALKAYLQRPGTLTITAKPPMPVAATLVLGTAELLPLAVPDILGLDVSVVPGPVPMPFDYVPPPDPNAPAPIPAQPDVRHVPQKKA